MPKLLRGEVHLFVGASGAGKTTLLMQSIGKHERGEEWPLEWDGNSIAYVATDRGSALIRKHIEAQKIQNIELYNPIEDRKFSEAIMSDRKLMLNHCLNALKSNYDTLILDPAGLFLPPNLNAYSEAAKGMFSLNRHAAQTGVTIILVHHATKMMTDKDFLRPQDRVSGSAALQGYSSSQVVLVQGCEKMKAWDSLHIVHHHAPAEEHHLVRDSAGYFELFEVQETIEKSNALIELIQDDEVISSKVLAGKAAKMGISQPTFYRLLSKLQQDGVITSVSRGTYKKVQNN